MVRVEGEKISLADLEQIVAGNADEVGLQYDPAEDAYVFVDASTDEQILIARRNGDVAIPVKADIESADITSLASDLDVDNFDLNNIATISGDTIDFSTFVADVLDLTDADIDKLVSNLSANGYNINAIGTASASTVSTSGIDGGVADGQGEITRLPGAGLSVENGDLVVTASFDGISGVSNPLTADLNADGFDVQNVNRLTTEELTDDDPIDLVGTDFVNAGHDEVDVPLVQNLTVADFEGGTLDTDVWVNDTSDFSIQSNTVESGTYALEGTNASSGVESSLYSLSGLSDYPQEGDTFSVHIQLTDGDDRPDFYFGATEVDGQGEYRAILSSSSNTVGIYSGHDDEWLSQDSLDLPNYLNEWLKYTVDWGADGEIGYTLEDSNGNVLSSGSGTSSKAVKSGGVGVRALNANTSSTQYYDSFTLTRRTNEYVTNTQKGTTELGNDVQPSGEISTGPLAAPDDATRAKYAEAPVTTDSTQGDESILTLLESADNPSILLRRILDGEGGSYANQLDGALGRFARINANLSWEYDTLADVSNWDSAGPTNYTFNVNNRPRRIHVEHDGSGGNDFGGAIASALTSYESIGGFRLTFKNAYYTENDRLNKLFFGLSNLDAETQVNANGTGLQYRLNESRDELLKINAGNGSNVALSSDVDWASNHDITLEYDGSEGRIFVDGEQRASISFSANADLSPMIQLNNDENNTSAETVECEQVTVEPLNGVLN